MSLEQIVAPALVVGILPAVRVSWRYGIAPWWRRHVQVRGELEVRVRFNDPPRE